MIIAYVPLSCNNVGMNRYFKENGKFTSEGAKKYGFKKDNKLGNKFESGENHWNYRGGYKYYRSGSRKTLYRKIKVNGKWIPEHRVVMEEKLGRSLLPRERIHHINHNGIDNRPENLMLFKNSGSHTSYHHSERKKK